ncbi:MAG: trypsin-like peptidase domain-containing protein [Phyllobacteriaceae bacterium]|nr:trypsin-like peptidase domain-containing protein [Phyllobacteriaceae bacterium]
MSKHTHSIAKGEGAGRPKAPHRPMGHRAFGLLGAVLVPFAQPMVPGHASERRVVVGHDGRVPLEAAVAARYAATGEIRCGGVRGIGQITGGGDVVTSAAHVFYDEFGRSRALQGACVFVVDGPGGREEVPLAPDARLCGSTSPYGAAGRHDWAVARLAHPIRGIRAYEIGGKVKAGDAITVVAWEGGRKTVDACRVREVVVGDNGAREIRTDCTGFDGMSGAAYLTPGRDPRVIGVHVGFRSIDPDRPAIFSDRHYTFGTAVGTVFRRALAAAESKTDGPTTSSE